MLKYLRLQLSNPLDDNDVLDLKINLKPTPIADKWFDHVISCLNKKLRVEKNFCWVGWPDPNRNINYLKNKLQDCVNRINHFADNNKELWNGYRIDIEWDDIASHDALNILHHHFEILMGQIWNVSEYMKTADDDTKYQIRQLNNLVHELQARKHVDDVRFEDIQPMSIISYLNVERELFDDDYYDYFDVNRNFGDVFLHYSQTGKTPIEAFMDQDDHVFDDNINALRYLSGEYNIWWGDSYSDEKKNKIKTDLRNWLNERNLIAAEHPDFSYYVDHEGNKQGIGWITVATIENPFPTKVELLKAVSKRLNITSLKVFNGNELLCEHTWNYSWADKDYEEQEIDALREYFPR